MSISSSTSIVFVSMKQSTIQILERERDPLGSEINPMTPSSTGKRHRVYRPLSVEGQGFDPCWKHLWGIFSRLAT
ncbi:hypothetical protein LXL04_003046 [Taraxacum kok-saghyz]